MKNYSKLQVSVSTEVKDSVKYETVHFHGTIYPRCLIVANKNLTKGWALNIKCRNDRPETIVKQFIKAMLLMQAEIDATNGTDAAKATGRRKANPLSSGLSSARIWVCDKHGNLISDSTFHTKGDDNLRKLFRITPSNPLYKLVIDEKRDWSDPKVKDALEANVTRTFELIDFTERFDAAIGRVVSEEDLKAIEADDAVVEPEPVVEEPSVEPEPIVEEKPAQPKAEKKPRQRKAAK